MEDPTSPPLQILGTRVPYVTRRYPLSRPVRTYKLFHSELLHPPRRRAAPGDLFIGQHVILYKSARKKWIRAHFHHHVRHPQFMNLHLSHDEWGPLWTNSNLQIPPGEPLPVAVRFRCALALFNRQRGSNPDDPIYLDD